MAVNFLGVGSGLDLQSMLTQLVQVASEPVVTRLGQEEVDVKNGISGIASLKSVMSDLEDAADALKESGLFSKKSASVTFSGDELFSVQADSGALETSYAISVEQLAQSSILRSSANFSSPGDQLSAGGTLTGDLEFTAGSSTFTLDGLVGTESAEDIVNAINSHEDNDFVVASIVDGKIVYKSSVTGSGNDLVVSASNGSSSELLDFASHQDDAGGVPVALVGKVSVTQAAQDSWVKIDGQDIYSSTNTLDGVISDLTITLSKADPGNSNVLEVSKDTGSVSSAISSFVTAYNKVNSTLNDLYGETDEDGNFTAGKLYGDSIIRQVQGGMSSLLTSIYDGAPDAISSAVMFGMNLQDDGSIDLDSEVLGNALSDNFDDLSSFFTGADGFATSFASFSENYVKFDGLIDVKDKSFDAMMDDIDRRFEQHQKYIESYQATLKAQFVNLDKVMSTMQSQLAYVQSQLASISG